MENERIEKDLEHEKKWRRKNKKKKKRNQNNNEMVKLLINYVNKWGKTPLFISCENENEAIVKYLVEHGADLKNDNLGETLLFNACENGNEAIVKCLIEHGADLFILFYFIINSIKTLYHILLFIYYYLLL